MSLHRRWVDRSAELVRAVVNGMPEQGSEHRILAKVEPDRDLGKGWYVLLARVGPNQIDGIGEGLLRHGSGSSAITYDVLEVAVEADRVRVRASITAPEGRLELLVPRMNQRNILSGLADGLGAVRENRLLDAFSRPGLDSIQNLTDASRLHGWVGLRPAQRRGVAACCSSGLQLIWGPPGTGKTHVIATAISHLAASGRRVLLVSSTNIAVDTALQEAVRIMQPTSGWAVRVGAVSLPSLRNDDRVNIDRVAEARLSQLRQQLTDLQARLDELARAGDRLTRAEARLAGFDRSGYEAALRRLGNAADLDRAHSRLRATRSEFEGAQASSSRARIVGLAVAWREAADRLSSAGASLGSVDDELTLLESQSWLKRRRGGVARLQAARTDLVAELASLGYELRRAQDAAHEVGAALTDAGGLDRERARQQMKAAEARLVAAKGNLRAAQQEVDRAAALNLPAPEDETRVAKDQSLWRLSETIPALQNDAREAERRRTEVSDEFEKLQKQLTRQKRGLMKEIVSEAQVVGTTLSQIALRPWITEKAFDHVIVDEAAAAQFPHLIHAVGRARIGAVLVGDYLQNSAIVERDLPGGPEAQAHFKTDCFSHFRATDPLTASKLTGCVVLHEQFRFGPALTELANRVAYGGVLMTAGNSRADIVVVTVDGLPEQLRTIHRGGKKHAGWWPVGALLARALAEHHQNDGGAEPFGVVVPYNQQRDAIDAALQDGGFSQGTVPVGTSHAFQGRQFDTVLVDLVEDGRGWIATANRNGNDYEFSGLRLFNVAVTRAKNRLYVLVTGRALSQARQGPLAALNEMVRSGAARSVDAGGLLGLSESERPVSGTPEGDLLAALDPYVRVDGIHDEDAAIEAAIIQIQMAEQSVWCWSAWVGKHAARIVDALADAHARGVEVHVVARPPDQVQTSNRDSLADLRSRLPHVVLMRDEHQKLIVTDGRSSLFGSMNLLSHGPRSSARLRDFMIAVDGPRFAEKLLAQQNAGELARRRRCPECQEPLIECGKAGGGDQRGWAWLCTNRNDRGIRHRLPFPAR